MFKKSLTAIMALVLAIFVAGCGGEEKPAQTQPTTSADKSIEIYTALFAKGDETNIASIGMSAENAKKITDALKENIRAQVAIYPLSDDVIAAVTDGYFDHLKEVTQISTKMKKDAAEHPVVEVTAKTLAADVEEDAMAQNEGVQALVDAMIAADEQGQTEADLKANEEFQLFAAECLGNIVGAIPIIERTLDVTCEKVQGDDGKIYWAPQDVEALMNFAQGK